jgi:hypothetical protein
MHCQKAQKIQNETQNWNRLEAIAGFKSTNH